MIQLKLQLLHSKTKYWLHKENFGPDFPMLITAPIRSINCDAFGLSSASVKVLNINMECCLQKLGYI